MTDAGTAIPAANILNVLGGAGIATSASGNTVLITNTSASAETLTGNSGGAVGPTLSNINILGSYTNTVVGNPGTSTLTITPTSSGYPITPYVVGVAGKAGYQTIQAAINAANAAGGGIVGVQPGTYVENLTLYDGCHVTGITFADAGGGVIIQGVHTPPSAGGFAFNNVQLESATHIFNSASAGSAHLIIGNAAIIVTNGYTFNLPNWTGKLETYDVNDRGSTNDGYVNNTGEAEIAIFSAAVGSGSGNIMTISGLCSIFTCAISCPINFVTGANAFMEYNVHGETITLSNNSTGEFIGCEIDTYITMSSSASWLIGECIINTSSNPALAGSGAGTLTLNDITFVNNAIIAGTLTVATTGGWFPPGNLGSSGYVLTSNGAGAVPTFQSVSAAGAITTITGDSGGAESPAAGNFNILGTGSITVAGSANTETVQLTGLTNHAIQIGAGTATLTQLGAGTTGQVLQTNTTADPTWSTATYPSIATGTGTILRADGTNWVATTATYPATTTINQILYSSSNNVVAGITAANNGTLISGATGIPSWLANGNTGQVLTATTGSPPSWATNTAFQTVNTQVFTADGTYTPTSGMKYCIIEVIEIGRAHV